jgi:hypothetical protein
MMKPEEKLLLSGCYTVGWTVEQCSDVPIQILYLLSHLYTAQMHFG